MLTHHNKILTASTFRHFFFKEEFGECVFCFDNGKSLTRPAARDQSEPASLRTPDPQPRHTHPHTPLILPPSHLAPKPPSVKPHLPTTTLDENPAYLFSSVTRSERKSPQILQCAQLLPQPAHSTRVPPDPFPAAHRTMPPAAAAAASRRGAVVRRRARRVASRTGLDERGWKWRRDGEDESDKLDCGVEENRGCGCVEGGDGEPVVQMMAEIRGVLDRLEWKGVGMVVVEEKKKGGKEEEEQQQQQRGRKAEIDISVRCLQAIPHFGPFFLQSSLGIEVYVGVLGELCYPLPLPGCLKNPLRFSCLFSFARKLALTRHRSRTSLPSSMVSSRPPLLRLQTFGSRVPRRKPRRHRRTATA